MELEIIEEKLFQIWTNRNISIFIKKIKRSPIALQIKSGLSMKTDKKGRKILFWPFFFAFLAIGWNIAQGI